MGTLYENIIALCESRGIKGGKLCTDLGISKGLLTDLKMGRRTGISAANAHKIASYFGVSVGYLLGEEEKAPAETGKRDEEGVNIIKIAGRDGSFRERRLTDQQLAALTLILDQMPDVPEDL